eukprot:236208-Ditylum_brightwellii.AAC.1
MTQDHDLTHRANLPANLDLELHHEEERITSCNVLLPAFSSTSMAVSFAPAPTAVSPTLPAPIPLPWPKTLTMAEDMWGAKLPVLLHICHTFYPADFPKLWWDLAAASTKHQCKILESTFYAVAWALKVDPPHVSYALLNIVMSLQFYSRNMDSMSSSFSLWHMPHMPPSEMDMATTLTKMWDAVLGQHAAVTFSDMTQGMKYFKFMPPTSWADTEIYLNHWLVTICSIIS